MTLTFRLLLHSVAQTETLTDPRSLVGVADDWLRQLINARLTLAAGESESNRKHIFQKSRTKFPVGDGSEGWALSSTWSVDSRESPLHVVP